MKLINVRNVGLARCRPGQHKQNLGKVGAYLVSKRISCLEATRLCIRRLNRQVTFVFVSIMWASTLGLAILNGLPTETVSCLLLCLKL